MFLPTLPTYPLSEHAVFKGGSSWNGSAAWYTDVTLTHRNNWPVGTDGLSYTADFSGYTGSVTAAATYAESIILDSNTTISGTLIVPPIFVFESGYASEVSFLAGWSGGADMFLKKGTGPLFISTNFTTSKLWVYEGTLRLNQNYFGPVIRIETGARLVFNSASNVFLTGTLDGSGTLEISGGGHLFLNGTDMGMRSYTPPASWSGTTISPEVNTPPVFSNSR